MDNLKEKIITIKEPINLNPENKKPIRFKDENDTKFILWKTNQQGESPSYNYFKQLDFNGEGATVGIAYMEEQKSFTNSDNKVIEFTERTVRVMKNPSEIKPENQTPNVPMPQSTFVSPKMAPARQNKPNTADVDWDKIAWGKCKYGFLVEAYKHCLNHDNGVTEAGRRELELEAEKWADMSMRKSPSRSGQAIPEMQTQDEIITENIPF